MQYVPTQFGVTGPDAAPLVSQLGAQAVGIGAYAMWNGMVYVEASGYQTAEGAWSFPQPGHVDADQVKLKGVNPYLRVALSHDWGPHSAMVGLLAMNGELYPDNLNPVGPTTQYRDRGVDAQYRVYPWAARGDGPVQLHPRIDLAWRRRPRSPPMRRTG